MGKAEQAAAHEGKATINPVYLLNHKLKIHNLIIRGRRGR